ncbi:uncharacterized protein NEMAJ01_0524 [Nematocida major]|uniref:uncharacterized protein n=1 Tax=Nematocida major TaxID=1912982 RepID=UPI0020083E1C|nr:uncharacterized protein NEMAJ01_0524 [Nematocida major]KAH9385628.1 hypothetical protein NEMAJ01_0524 [Nematocida major]
MSLESAKRRVKRNKSSLNKLLLGTCISNVVAVVVYILLRKSLLATPIIITAAVEGSFLGLLYYLVNPTFIKTSKGLEIKDCGVDMEARGVIRIFKDIIYLSCTTKLASIVFKEKAFIVMLMIPISAYYEIFMRREVRPKMRN